MLEFRPASGAHHGTHQAIAAIHQSVAEDDDRADATPFGDIRTPCSHTVDDLALVSPFIARELKDASSKCPEHLGGGGCLDVGVSAEA